MLCVPGVRIFPVRVGCNCDQEKFSIRRSSNGCAGRLWQLAFTPRTVSRVDESGRSSPILTIG